MRKLIRIIFLLSILVFALSCGNNDPNTGGIVYSNPWDGTSSEKPSNSGGIYIITEGKHLAWLAEQPSIVMDVRFDANIDMNSKLFGGIKSFTGTMDGNGKRIKSLNINNDTIDDSVGLICEMTDGNIKNLTIESGNIKGKVSVGAFVGESTGSITITGVVNKATVESIALVCSTGGIIGESTGIVEIDKALNLGNITASGGNGDAGGIIGETTGTATTIKNAGNSGVVIGGYAAGGIIGETSSAVTINNVVNSGAITGGNVSAAGAAGAAGGIIGETSSTVTINNALNSGTITSEEAGGIIGETTGAPTTIKNAGNSGVITAFDGSGDAGGIIGETSSTVTIDFAYNYRKDLKMVGYGPDPSITSSYSLNPTDKTCRTLNTTQFKFQFSFVGWDFGTIWKMGILYPVLR